MSENGHNGATTNTLYWLKTIFGFHTELWVITEDVGHLASIQNDLGQVASCFLYQVKSRKDLGMAFVQMLIKSAKR